MPLTPLRDRVAYKALERHHGELAGRHPRHLGEIAGPPLRTVFEQDRGRGERLTAQACGLYLDYSKNRVTDETVRLLLDLAEESGVTQRRDAMLRGEHINVSEDRAVGHVALRRPRGSSFLVDGGDAV